MSEFEQSLKIIGRLLSAVISLVMAIILFGALGDFGMSSGFNMAPILGLGFFIIVVAIVVKILQEFGLIR